MRTTFDYFKPRGRQDTTVLVPYTLGNEVARVGQLDDVANSLGVTVVGWCLPRPLSSLRDLSSEYEVLQQIRKSQIRVAVGDNDQVATLNRLLQSGVPFFTHALGRTLCNLQDPAGRYLQPETTREAVEQFTATTHIPSRYIALATNITPNPNTARDFLESLALRRVASAVQSRSEQAIAAYDFSVDLGDEASFTDAPLLKKHLSEVLSLQ